MVENRLKFDENIEFLGANSSTGILLSIGIKLGYMSLLGKEEAYCQGLRYFFQNVNFIKLSLSIQISINISQI